MGFRLFLLFVVVPMIELALLVRIGEVIGFWNTVLIIVATGLIGSALARREGLSVWRRFNERLATGGLPGKELVDGLIILVSGALLLTPGVLTDVVGLLGLLPPTRALIRRVLQQRFARRIEEGRASVRFGVFGGQPGFGPGPQARPPSGSPEKPPAAGRQDISDVVESYRREP